MKVTVKLIKGDMKTARGKGTGATASLIYIEDVVYIGIGTVLWEDDWVRLLPLDSRIQQISYRKELVFAVIEEKE